VAPQLHQAGIRETCPAINMPAGLVVDLMKTFLLVRKVQGTKPCDDTCTNKFLNSFKLFMKVL
jgi:hypothetical protein